MSICGHRFFCNNNCLISDYSEDIYVFINCLILCFFMRLIFIPAIVRFELTKTSLRWWVWLLIVSHCLLILLKMDPYMSMQNSTMEFLEGDSHEQGLKPKTNWSNLGRYTAMPDPSLYLHLFELFWFICYCKRDLCEVHRNFFFPLVSQA